MGTTCIRRAAWAVVWSREHRAHRYAREVDIAFGDAGIEFVGEAYQGPVSEEVDGARVCVMPGLVNVHCHPTSQPLTRGVREELGNPRLYSSALYDRTGLWQTDDEGLIAGAEIGLSESLKSGVTTILDYPQRVPEGWLEVLARSGIRAFAAPTFADARWVVEGESKVGYEWDERAGREQWERALALIEEADRHDSGRLSGVVAPAQVDTCTPETLQLTHRVAMERGCMWQVHAAQTLSEFHEMTQRHGMSPVQWLDSLGVLGPSTTLGHCIFIDAHPWTHWTMRKDLETLASSGATVAHCPTVFSRYGHIMHSLGGYLRAGVNVGMGCDTAPHNLLEEMRHALILSRVAAGQMDDIYVRDVFNAATIGGARALGRTDIGRLDVGSKSDLVLLDLDNPYMRPTRDPLRNLVFTAADRAVRDVYVDGRKVVADGVVETLDTAAAAARLELAQMRAEQGVSERDPLGRSGLEIAPLVY
jgi:cytosine/adenosine deaminase-related metal-dependent hydrolase